jgi:hypothetical protein
MSQRPRNFCSATATPSGWKPDLRAPNVRLNLERGGVSAMLSCQVGRVKITRIVEMDLPVPAIVIPQATSSATARRSGLRCEGVEPHSRLAEG